MQVDAVTRSPLPAPGTAIIERNIMLNNSIYKGPCDCNYGWMANYRTGTTPNSHPNILFGHPFLHSFMDETTRTVTVYGRDTFVKNVTLTDETGSIKLALWRELAASEMKIGDRIQVTHCSLRRDQKTGKQTLQTTQHSALEKRKAPPAAEKPITVIAFIEEDAGEITLIAEDGTEYKTTKELLKPLVADNEDAGDNFEDALLAKMPITCRFKMEAGNIVQLL